MTARTDGTLAALMPPEVAVASETDPSAAGPLFACEEAAVNHAIASRRTEFAVGRTCARRALAQLGAAPAAICVGSMREPLWPEGFVGSITHCRSFWAAAAARSSALSALGLDAAVNRSLAPKVRDRIVASDEEAALVRRADPEVCWDVVLFSAKEAVFKAWWPLRRQWLAFGDARVVLDDAAGTFHADVGLAGGDSAGSVRGRFAVEGELVIAAVVIETGYG
jgi:4'-phosphopantetheinyl transferase EntD